MGFLHHFTGSYTSPTGHVVHTAVALVIYISACRLFMRQLSGHWREILLAGFNLAAVYGFLFYGRPNHANWMFLIYVALVCFQYVMLRVFAERKGNLPWLAFFTPIVALIIVRYGPIAGLPKVPGLAWTAGLSLAGISYLAFRASRLVLEVRNGAVKQPSFLQISQLLLFPAHDARRPHQYVRQLPPWL